MRIQTSMIDWNLPHFGIEKGDAIDWRMAGDAVVLGILLLLLPRSSSSLLLQFLLKSRVEPISKLNVIIYLFNAHFLCQNHTKHINFMQTMWKWGSDCISLQNVNAESDHQMKFRRRRKEVEAARITAENIHQFEVLCFILFFLFRSACECVWVCAYVESDSCIHHPAHIFNSIHIVICKNISQLIFFLFVSSFGLLFHSPISSNFGSPLDYSFCVHVFSPYPLFKSLFPLHLFSTTSSLALQHTKDAEKQNNHRVKPRR